MNTLEFDTADLAKAFEKSLIEAKKEALLYPHNENESLVINRDENNVSITWGKPEDNE